MELSREVHTLLERIKKLSQHAQKDSTTQMPYNLPLKISQLNLNSSSYNTEEVQFSNDDLINVEAMDFSDDERWLYVSEMSMISPYTGDLTNWLHQDFNTVEDDISELDSLQETRKVFVDTRTFTRPKKRISRPSLEQLTEGYSQSQSSSSKTSVSDYHDISKMSLTEESSNESYYSDYLLSNTNSVQFKLSEPVSISFDKILANAGELDSFTNMSPPSLMNSLCSSTFTNLMDSGYVQQPEIVPNDVVVMQTSINENDDPNITKNENETYENKINGTFNLSKKARISHSFKASCPDINRTFQLSRDSSLDLTFQKLSDSQPNLTEDLKRTIFNQSMELMHPETYHSARSGSADSLDERSSSISNSSKDSGKIMNMGDLDNLAKAQELRLHQAMSTPKPSKSRLMMLETMSPIPVCSRNNPAAADEEFLSDSDMSDTCVTARSGFSKPFLTQTQALDKPEVRKPSLRSLPTMIVKPMEPNRTQSAQSIPVRPKLRMSGLPRPTSTLATGIGIPRSRIPGPKTLRPPSVRPQQKQNWMDGCY